MSEKIKYPKFSLKEGIIFCKILHKCKGVIVSDVTIAKKYNLHPRDHALTYRTSAFVDFGLIVRRKGKKSELTQTGLKFVNSKDFTKKEIEEQKILSFLNCGGIKLILRHILMENKGKIYENEKFSDFLLKQGVATTKVDDVIAAFNESLEFLNIVDREGKIILKDEFIKLVNEDELNVVTKNQIEKEIEQTLDNPEPKENSPVLEVKPFLSRSGISGEIIFSEKFTDSSGRPDYYITFDFTPTDADIKNINTLAKRYFKKKKNKE